jgi:hypothetical protein
MKILISGSQELYIIILQLYVTDIPTTLYSWLSLVPLLNKVVDQELNNRIL